MGRPWREECRGGIYHVIARGNNKEYIFKENIDKGYFLKLLKEYSASMKYVIYGYVLMDNHYHIIIQTNESPLQGIMHQINNQYSKLFNSKYNRVGHVFQGRYKAIHVQDERYLLQLLRYVHQNPVQAGMCEKVNEYKWSSDIYYRGNIKDFIDTSIVLEMLSRKTQIALKKYEEFMNEEEIRDFDKMKAIGEEAYQIMCSNRKRITERKRLDEILIDTDVSIEDYKLIKEASRKRHLIEYKLAYANNARKLKYTNKEIGENIGLTESAIKELVRRNQRRSDEDE